MTLTKRERDALDANRWRMLMGFIQSTHRRVETCQMECGNPVQIRFRKTADNRTIVEFLPNAATIEHFDRKHQEAGR